ncbi:MAG: hypothetical protein CMG74_13230 [Candidatus Marinimicrobia bacterium]|nr:hypothetical protein [Candidatus Neomarinimicrobiota bacterium]
MKKKILILIEAWCPYKGGGQKHTEYLINGLIKDYNCNVTLLTRKLIINNNNFTNNESKKNGLLKIFRLGKLSTFDSKVGKISWIIGSVYYCIKREYDLIHAMPNLGAIPGKILSVLLKKPIVYSIQGSTFEAKVRKRKLFKRIKNYILFFIQTKINYDAVISDSSRIDQFFNRKKLYIIHNGVEAKMFDVNVIRDGHFRLLFIGRLHKQKGLKFLIEAMEKVVSINNKIELIIVGDGEEKTKLLSKVNSLNLDNNIKFIGEKKYQELPKIYSSSDLFILPSIFEGQPLSLLEAWASKLPVLVTDCGENNKMVIDNYNGWIVPISDYNALAEKIIFAMKMKKEELKKIGLNGYNNVIENHNWNNKINEVYKVYNSLIKYHRNAN